MPVSIARSLTPPCAVNRDPADCRFPEAVRSGGRLRIVLLNLMPDGAATFAQIAGLLDRSPFEVELLPLALETRRPGAAPRPEEAGTFTLSQLSRDTYDGLIVTGAPVERLPFEEVRYWPELLALMAWARNAVEKRLYICWAAQAALHAAYGIPKILLEAKLFGVYEQAVRRPDSPLMRGLAPAFPTPVSRHATIDRAALEDVPEVEILAEAADRDVCLAATRDGADVFMMNHLEYDVGTLPAEYERDLARGMRPQRPAGCFPDDDSARAPAKIWDASAQRFFDNWLALRPGLATGCEARSLQVA